MKARTTLVTLLVFTASLVGASAAGARGEDPRIELWQNGLEILPDDVVDWGQLAPGEVVKKSFKLTNFGPGDVSLGGAIEIEGVEFEVNGSPAAIVPEGESRWFAIKTTGLGGGATGPLEDSPGKGTVERAIEIHYSGESRPFSFLLAVTLRPCSFDKNPDGVPLLPTNWWSGNVYRECSSFWWTLSNKVTPAELITAWQDVESHRSRYAASLSGPPETELMSQVTLFVSGKDTPELVPMWEAFQSFSHLLFVTDLESLRETLRQAGISEPGVEAIEAEALELIVEKQIRAHEIAEGVDELRALRLLSRDRRGQSAHDSMLAVDDYGALAEAAGTTVLHLRDVNWKARRNPALEAAVPAIENLLRELSAPDWTRLRQFLLTDVAPNLEYSTSFVVIDDPPGPDVDCDLGNLPAAAVRFMFNNPNYDVTSNPIDQSEVFVGFTGSVEYLGPSPECHDVLRVKCFMNYEHPGRSAPVTERDPFDLLDDHANPFLTEEILIESVGTELNCFGIDHNLDRCHYDEEDRGTKFYGWVKSIVSTEGEMWHNQSGANQTEVGETDCLTLADVTVTVNELPTLDYTRLDMIVRDENGNEVPSLSRKGDNQLVYTGNGGTITRTHTNAGIVDGTLDFKVRESTIFVRCLMSNGEEELTGVSVGQEGAEATVNCCDMNESFAGKAADPACSNAFSVGGTVTYTDFRNPFTFGTVNLSLNQGQPLSLTLPSDTTRSFTFPDTLEAGDSYQVSVVGTDLICYVSNGSGTISGTDVSDVVVACHRFPHDICSLAPTLCETDDPPQCYELITTWRVTVTIVLSLPFDTVTAVTETTFTTISLICEGEISLGPTSPPVKTGSTLYDGPIVYLRTRVPEPMSQGFTVRGVARNDNEGIRSVQLYLDGQPITLDGFSVGEYDEHTCDEIESTSCDPFSGFSGFLDVSGLAAGNHQLIAKATSDNSFGLENVAVLHFEVASSQSNRAPNAVNDTFAVLPDTSIDYNVLENDNDPDGDSIALSADPVVSPPSHGTAVRVSSTTIGYTPAAGFTGSDSFTYEIADSSGATDTATATVIVTDGVPDPVSGFQATINGQNIVGLTVYETDPTVHLTWSSASHPAGIDQYQIILQPTDGSGWLYDPLLLYPSTSYTLNTSNLEPEKSYSTHIRARSTLGFWSDFTTQGYFTVVDGTPGPPDPVPDFQATIDGESIVGLTVYETDPTVHFTWSSASHPAGIDQYQIVLQPTDGSGWLYDPLLLYPSTSYTLNTGNLEPGKSYSTHIRARNTLGVWGDFSTQGYFTVSADPPDPVTNFQATINGESVVGLTVYETDPTVHFTWNSAGHPAGIDQYQIILQPTDGSGWLYDPLLLYPSTSYTLNTSNLEPGKSYSTHIRARNTLGIWSDFTTQGYFTVQ